MAWVERSIWRNHQLSERILPVGSRRTLESRLINEGHRVHYTLKQLFVASPAKIELNIGIGGKLSSVPFQGEDVVERNIVFQTKPNKLGIRHRYEYITNSKDNDL